MRIIASKAQPVVARTSACASAVPSARIGLVNSRYQSQNVPRDQLAMGLEAVEQVFGLTGDANAQHALVDEGARFVHVALVVHRTVDGNEVVSRQRQPFENEW